MAQLQAQTEAFQAKHARTLDPGWVPEENATKQKLKVQPQA
jgi:hypothetical protein